MRSRRYRARVAGLALVLCTGSSLAQQVRILVQNSPLAGFQYYSGKIVWDEMREGDPLVLVREPDNRHDTAAIRVEWRGVQLGHLPRAENAALAAEMDRGVKVEGRIGRLTKDPNPWKRLRVEVYVLP